MGPTISEVDDSRDALDPERLRNITANFIALRGSLGFAAFGAALAAEQMMFVVWHWSYWTGLGVLLTWLGAILFWFIYSPRYDTSRFGWVQPKQLEPSSKQLALWAGVVVGLLVVYIAANLLQDLVPMPVNFLILLQSAGFFCLILYFAFVRRSPSMPIRLTIWAAVVAAQGIVAVLPIWVSLSPRQVLFCKLLNEGSMGILIMIMGLSNHVAMLRMLPKPFEKNDHD